jgi:transmembrane sensor
VLDERSQGLAAAVEHIDAEFGAPRIEQGVKSLERRIARRRAVRGGMLGAGATSLVLLALWLARVDEPRAPEPSRVATASRLETRDGSEARGIGHESVLALEHDAADEVRLRLVRGKGHFEVKPNRQRRYRVRAGEVDVEVLGTAFIVERLAARAPATERTRVRVEHGVVKVAWRGGSAVLHAGDEGLFPPLSEAPKPLAVAPAARLEQPVEPEQSEPESPAQTSERWRSLARAGKHKEAFSSISKKPIDDLSGLLLAADAARLSGHPREAASYLERLIARYPRSTSAHLSAFTLGRLALYELHEPALAARSFAQAYALNPKGPLAEDALAREAEAYHRAGDDERAKRAVERYLARYPKGARRAELLRYAGRGAAE